MADGLTRVEAEGKAAHAANRNGWGVRYDLGRCRRDYLHRAGVAWAGLGGCLPRDLVSPVTHVDADSRPLEGRYDYVLRFPPGAAPPVRAFWSLTVDGGRYDARRIEIEPNAAATEQWADLPAAAHTLEASPFIQSYGLRIRSTYCEFNSVNIVFFGPRLSRREKSSAKSVTPVRLENA